MAGKFWNSDKLLSLFAVFVSVSTLMVFIYQTNLIRQQQFMSVYPHLSLSNFNSGSIDYEYVLMNDGVGPAFIKSVEVKDSMGQNYGNISAYLLTKLDEHDSISIFNSDIFVGQLIPANKKIVLYGLFDEAETSARGAPKNTVDGARKLRRVLNSKDLRVTITYSSIYGETWSITNGSEIPIKQL